MPIHRAEFAAKYIFTFYDEIIKKEDIQNSLWLFSEFMECHINEHCVAFGILCALMSKLSSNKEYQLGGSDIASM